MLIPIISSVWVALFFAPLRLSLYSMNIGVTIPGFLGQPAFRTEQQGGGSGGSRPCSSAGSESGAKGAYLQPLCLEDDLGVASWVFVCRLFDCVAVHAPISRCFRSFCESGFHGNASLPSHFARQYPPPARPLPSLSLVTTATTTTTTTTTACCYYYYYNYCCCCCCCCHLSSPPTTTTTTTATTTTTTTTTITIAAAVTTTATPSTTTTTAWACSDHSYVVITALSMRNRHCSSRSTMAIIFSTRVLVIINFGIGWSQHPCDCCFWARISASFQVDVATPELGGESITEGAIAEWTVKAKGAWTAVARVWGFNTILPYENYCSTM